MDYRVVGRTGWSVSAVGFGAWAIGGSWGTVSDEESKAALHAAVDTGVTLFDTANVYGDGRSERLIGQLLRDRPAEGLRVVTKMGRSAPLELASYTPANFRSWVDQSRLNLGVDRLDLTLLHCPPPVVLYHPEVFEALDDLVRDGSITAYGVSVERVEEGLKAIEYPGVAFVEIIYNIFRQRPAELFLAAAARRGVGILARVPLASGLLTGKLTAQSTFEATDHRNFNRHGESFDVGETFSGIDFETGLEAVEELRPLVPPGASMSQLALRWILMNQHVTSAIPGARNAAQAVSNSAAADLPPLSAETMAAIERIYAERIKPLVHQRW